MPDRARETDRLRQHYRLHRETLSGLIGDAPSDHLATAYQRLVDEIDIAVRKLDELEGSAPSSMETNPAYRPKTHPGSTAPGNRPLVRTDEPTAPVPGGSQWRVAVMIIAALLVIGVIAYLMWPAKKTTQPTIVEAPLGNTATTTSQTSTIVPVPMPPPAEALKIVPALADYGPIRKGTRAVRQFELTNTSGSPIEIQVARSACRCLFYDYKAKLPVNGKETITVTVDGARAKAGELREEVQVTSKTDPTMSATFTVQALIR